MGNWVENPVILCIDDESSVLQAVRSQLRDHFGNGMDVEVASSGTEAIGIVQDLLEDGVELWVVLCDEIMPERRGHEVLAEIHEMSPETRTILLTGQAEIDAVTESVNRANLFHFIEKPWEKMDLLMTIDRAIDSLQADKERERRTEAFYRFVPADFLSILGVHDPVDAEVNIGMMQTMSVLFTDIRRFTALSESEGPERVFSALNDVFDVIVPLITEHNGVVDKFIGDAVMALFRSAEEATLAGLDIVASVEQLQTSLGEIRVGVGINSGDLILGTVGTAARIQTTVIGDVVNVAARLEALTKLLQSPLLLSDASAAKTTVPCRYLGRFAIRGRQESLGVHQCLQMCSPAERSAIDAGAESFAEITDLAGVMLQADRLDPLGQYTQQHPDDALALAMKAVIMDMH